MRNHIAIENQYLHDINPRVCGYEDCLPAYSFGPTTRDFWVLHYIVEGEGLFLTGGQEYHLHPSQIFVIRPGELTFYKADQENPWKYFWIGFDSTIAMPRILDEPVFAFPQAKPLFEEMYLSRKLDSGREAYLCGKIWELLSLLSSKQKNAGRREIYIQQAKNFMETEYMMGISVNEVAAHLALSRSYFSNMFRESEGKSPQQYLTEIRMHHAAIQMIQLGYTIAETAASVGYSDTFAFSRMFKQYYGVSPSDYKNRYS